MIVITASTAVACAVGAPPSGHTQYPSRSEPPPPAQVPQPSSPAPAPVDRNDLPEVTVIDVASGESLVMASLAPADRPILVWTYAPH